MHLGLNSAATYFLAFIHTIANFALNNMIIKENDAIEY